MSPGGANGVMQGGIHGGKMIGCHQPFGDALLIRDDVNGKPGLVEATDGISDAGQEAQFVGRTNVIAGQIDIQDAVTVQKYGGTRHNRRAIFPAVP
jgi:hypothetical protein